MCVETNGGKAGLRLLRGERGGGVGVVVKCRSACYCGGNERRIGLLAGWSGSDYCGP